LVGLSRVQVVSVIEIEDHGGTRVQAWAIEWVPPLLDED
jgi:hypothetical protein